jgi:hypothetical protein
MISTLTLAWSALLPAAGPLALPAALQGASAVTICEMPNVISRQ